MVRAVVRMLLACMLVFSVFLPAAAAAAPAHSVALAQQPTPQQPGPDIPPAPNEQDGAQSREKLVIAVVAILLLGIVILGHRTRSKRRKESESG